MGGDTVPLSTPPSFPPAHLSSYFPLHRWQIPSVLEEQDKPTLPRGNENLSIKTEDGKKGRIIGEVDEISSVHREILESYDQLWIRSKNLNQAKRNFLSYSPGARIEQAGGMKLSDYDILKTTSLILIGPKGSGKSSLINRISKLFEEDPFAPDRAQVSCNSSDDDGTFFLQEYMILRESKSFCLYDTRSLSEDSYENIEMLKQWMTEGVCNGELVTRKSDASSLIDRMRCKAGQGFPLSRRMRMVNFVIFVVDGLSVLKSFDGDDIEKDCDRVITTAFNCPYLSYRDDKPVVVITHGDLLSLADRVRVRVHLGNLLCIPPTQIFDIPESNDPVTELTIIDMLRYCLEHADKNLPSRSWTVFKDHVPSISADIFFLTVMAIVIISAYLYHAYIPRCPEQPGPQNQMEPQNALEEIKIVWHVIRLLLLRLKKEVCLRVQNLALFVYSFMEKPGQQLIGG